MVALKLTALALLALAAALPTPDPTPDPLAGCPAGQIRCCPGAPCMPFQKCLLSLQVCIPKPDPPVPPVDPGPVDPPPRGPCKPCNAPKGQKCTMQCVEWDD